MDDIAYCERTGVFGQKIVMLDFSPERLDYYPKIGSLVEFYDTPGKVETAWHFPGRLRNQKFSVPR
jgi:hypothetical protein